MSALPNAGERPTLGETIRHYRLSRGYTKAALLDAAIGGTRGRIAQIERGVASRMERERLERIAIALDLTDAETADLMQYATPDHHPAPDRIPLPRFTPAAVGPLGRLVRRHREAIGWNLSDMARVMGCSSSWPLRIEGGRTVSQATAEQLIAVFRLSRRDADELMLAAGFAPSYAGDRTIRQLAALLDEAPDEVAVMLRAMISAGYRVLAAGDVPARKEGAG